MVKYSLDKLKIEWKKIFNLFSTSINLNELQKQQIKQINQQYSFGLIDPVETSNKIKMIIGTEQYNQVIEMFEDQLNLLLLNHLRYRMSTSDPNLNQFRLTLNKYKPKTSPESFAIAEKKLDSLIQQFN